ncbi:MAG: hypothetical protein JWR10_1417 [Rubritepida sp.]|nr:hypothetical protein [Rubritepida sp.]
MSLSLPGGPWLPASDALLDFRAIVDGAEDAVMVTDADLDAPGPTIRYVNPAFTRLTGYTAEQAIGRSPRMLQGPGSDPDMLRAISVALRHGEGIEARVLNYGRDGTPCWIDLRIVPLAGTGGGISHFAAFQRPCAPENSGLDELAGRDALTGLASRRALVNMVRQHLLDDAAEHLGFAYLAIDNFKRLSEADAPPIGDALLMGFADILRANLRRSDAPGRLGGEEFGICMPGIRLPEARALAGRVLASVQAQPFATPAGPIAITCSIGIGMAQRGDTLHELLERADAALDSARRQGCNRVVID